MASRKSKSKRKSKSSSRKKPEAVGVSPRVRALIVLLVIVGVIGIAAVKFFQTPAGRVVLLDRGFHSYYAQVREDIGEEVRDALERHGLRDRIHETVGFARVDGKRITFLEWDIPCDRSVDFITVNVDVTKEVQHGGAYVRLSEERDEGRTLVLHVGSRRYDTHHITLRKGKSVGTTRPRTLPKLALVIDDFGYTRGGVPAEILQLNLPLSIAIIPTLPQSAYMLERAREARKCTLLHLPMEAGDDEPVGVPPVTTAMTDGEIEAMVQRYLDMLPGVDGVNNHQGSVATTDPRVMSAVLDVVKSRRLFFLDSLTSAKSVAYNTARELGLPAARNALFLDADTEESYVVEERLHRAVSIARRNGSAVAIGHPHPWTLEALRDSLTFLKGSGVELVYVSELVQ